MMEVVSVVQALYSDGGPGTPARRSFTQEDDNFTATFVPHQAGLSHNIREEEILVVAVRFPHILGGVLAVLDGAVIDHRLVRVVEKIHVARQQRRVSPRQHLRENLSGVRMRNQYLTCNLPHRETIS